MSALPSGTPAQRLREIASDMRNTTGTRAAFDVHALCTRLTDCASEIFDVADSLESPPASFEGPTPPKLAECSMHETPNIKIGDIVDSPTTGINAVIGKLKDLPWPEDPDAEPPAPRTIHLLSDAGTSLCGTPQFADSASTACQMCAQCAAIATVYRIDEASGRTSGLVDHSADPDLTSQGQPSSMMRAEEFARWLLASDDDGPNSPGPKYTDLAKAYLSVIGKSNDLVALRDGGKR